MTPKSISWQNDICSSTRRGLPVGEEAVAGSAIDLRRRTLRGLTLDDCYTGLSVGSDGRWRARLELDDRRTELWADAAFAYAMCYTGDSLGDPAERRRAMAIEPMTCPPERAPHRRRPDRAAAGGALARQLGDRRRPELTTARRRSRQAGAYRTVTRVPSGVSGNIVSAFA